MLPVQILKQNAQEERGEGARLSSFVGAIAIGDLVKSTLGPKGMDYFFKDKILLCGEGDSQQVQVTNDGATILKSIGVDNPAAKVLVEISMTQDSEVGDGTTSVSVLAAELLKEAERLIAARIHPQIIIAGYRRALKIAQDALRASAKTSSPTDMRDDLLKIARTTLGSKILAQHKEHFAQLAVNAVLRLKGSGCLESIQIIKKLGGSMDDSYLDEETSGHVPTKKVENAKILIANTPMDTDKNGAGHLPMEFAVKVFGSRVRVDSVAKVAELEVNKIIAHKINVFINRQLIYNYPEQLFADAGIMAIEHADFEGIERLALVLGGEIVSTFDSPEIVKLGSCKLIEEVMIAEDRLLRFSGVPIGEACSIVVRGSTQQILDEAERSLHDALCVLVTHVKEARTVAGAGASEILMSTAAMSESQKIAGKESLAVEAFARALAQLPIYICDNAGLDSAEIVSKLRAYHSNGNHSMGIDIEEGEPTDVIKKA
ncbi:T-complex protein 1 subunit beta [Dirofilaria immitis]|nr:T-complex protein 1 subunit beta [Dirofilaria immitis]